MQNRDLIIISFAAHQKFMYYRMSNKKKMIQFLSKTRQILEDLDEGRKPLLMKIPEKDCGQNIAIDIYNEICYNINTRFI